MVVFTCNNCGDSLQKPRVEKHYSFACRSNKSLTCVDCLKDFRGEEYISHTKCLTEDERYAAKGTFANGIVKKGEVKQESWVEMIKSILDTESNLKPSCRNLLDTISHYSNIPRKKPKFINFIQSSSGGRANMKDVEEVWNIIEKYKSEKAKSGNNEKVDESQNGGNNINEEKNSKDKENESKKRKTTEAEDTPKKKKHKKNQEIEEAIENENGSVENTLNDQKKKKKQKKDKEEIIDTNNEVVEENAKFNFQQKIVEIVTAKQSISLKKLQKKVLNAYIKKTGESEITPKAIKKFNKKLKKIPNLEVTDDKVTILEKDN